MFDIKINPLTGDIDNNSTRVRGAALVTQKVKQALLTQRGEALQDIEKGVDWLTIKTVKLSAQALQQIRTEILATVVQVEGVISVAEYTLEFNRMTQTLEGSMELFVQGEDGEPVAVNINIDNKGFGLPVIRSIGQTYASY